MPKENICLILDIAHVAVYEVLLLLSIQVKNTNQQLAPAGESVKDFP